MKRWQCLTLAAVVLSIAAVVPAVARTSATGKAAATSACKVVRATKSVRVTVCRGPRGFRGVRGLAGARGPRGHTGPRGLRGLPGAAGSRGAIGPAGPAGTARAYAVVDATAVGLTASATGLVAARTQNVTAVRRAAPGTYCLTIGGGIDTTRVAPVAAGEFGYSPSTTIPIAVVDTTTAACAAGEIAIRTFDAKSTAGTPDNVAFSVAVP
jgi:hypothetical protein